MSMTVTTVPCPQCLAVGQISLLANQPGIFETFCVNASRVRGPHKWNDREELNVAIASAKQQFPDRYRGPQAPTPTPVSKDIYIDPETKLAIEQIVKQQISGAGDLKGIVFEAVTRADELEKEQRQLKASVETMRKNRGGGAAGTLAPNQAIITIPEWAESEVDNFAEHEGKTRQEWLSEQMEAYLESFCTQAQAR